MKDYPYWWDTVPSRKEPASSTTLNSQLSTFKFDVAVVGAGYTGLAAARVMARAGASVVVLDRERVGWGASSRNGGQVLTGLKAEPHALVARYGESRARTVFNASLEAIAHLETLIAGERIDCEYERTGHVQAAVKRAHFDAFREEQALFARVFAHRVELVGAQDQRGELGTDAYYGLLLDERSGAINPARYVDGLAAAARRAGATIVTGVTAERAARNGRRWTVTVRSAHPGNPGNLENVENVEHVEHGEHREHLDVGDILLATNGYTGSISPMLQRRFIPIGSYIIATEPLEASLAARLIPRRRMAFDSRHFLHYFRLSQDQRLLFGGRAEFSVPTPETTRHAAEVLRQEMIQVFPELADVRVDFAWSGNVAFTRDELPHAGRLEDGMYFAGGYCGHGIAMATQLGELVGRRIAGQLIEHPLMNDHFPAIPFYDGKPWFLPLVGAYYRFLDYVV